MNTILDVIKRQLYPTVSGLVVFLLFFLLFLNNMQDVQNDQKNRARTELDALTDMIEFNINEELSNVKVFEVFVKDSLEHFGDIDVNRLNMYAEYILEASECIDLVTLSPEGVIQFVVPLAENEMMLGYDLLDEKTRSEFVERSVELKSAVAQGPVETIQGELRVFNRLPIFIEQDGQEVFWGLISISLDFERFIEKHKIRMESDLFDYVIHVPLVDGYIDFYWGDKSIFDKEYISENLYLPELTWQIAMYPKKGWYQYSYLDLPYLLIGIVLSAVVFLVVKNIQIRHLNYKQKATIDSLTGCNNRLGFDQLLENKTILEKDNALVIADLDDFKTINDLLGHNTGDFILKEIASLIKSGVRESDQVFRIGGDEFVILLKNIKNHNEIMTIVQRLINIGNKEVVFDSKKISISLSIGIAISGDGGTTIDELYKKADANLYRAKEKGKNQFFID